MRLNAIWSLGFAEAGLSLLRVAADGSELSDVDWPIYRDALIDVARCELERAMRGQPIRLTNFAVALKQIHAGAARLMPAAPAEVTFPWRRTETGMHATAR